MTLSLNPQLASLTLMMIYQRKLRAREIRVPKIENISVHAHSTYLPVRYHHGHSPELHFKVFRKFLSACVSRILKASKKKPMTITDDLPSAY